MMHPDYWDRDGNEAVCDHAHFPAKLASPDEQCDGEAIRCAGCSDVICERHRNKDGYCGDCRPREEKTSALTEGIAGLLAEEFLGGWKAA